jgi:5-methylcytosine-specific restriction protein A
LTRSEIDGSIHHTVISDFEVHIRNIFKSVVTKYQQAKTESLKGHPMGEVLRNKMKQALIKRANLDPNIYHLVGSVGQGQWAENTMALYLYKRFNYLGYKGLLYCLFVQC